VLAGRDAPACLAVDATLRHALHHVGEVFRQLRYIHRAGALAYVAQVRHCRAIRNGVGRRHKAARQDPADVLSSLLIPSDQLLSICPAPRRIDGPGMFRRRHRQPPGGLKALNRPAQPRSIAFAYRFDQIQGQISPHG
jgi:hypothetical protein